MTQEQKLTGQTVTQEQKPVVRHPVAVHGLTIRRTLVVSLSPPLLLHCTQVGRVKEGIVYYESLKRELKTKTIYGFRCDERLQTKVEEFTRLACTLLCPELEHLKIETRLTSETPVSEMGEYASVML